MADRAKRLNILVLWGDDIGTWNISFFNRGQMGYRTPNIDRIATEGIAFTDSYGQQSCTAGRSAFITGQNPVRTGLTKVGLPGATLGISPLDPTIAELLKPLGYATGQFGKNHLGDRDEHLPTNHGFDEFFGNLYHLNAEEEPEHPDYPKDPEFFKKFGPRGVIHSFAGGKITDTGPLDRKRMETIDDEITAKTLEFIDKAHKADKPFFVWWNTTHMHFRTRIKKSIEGLSGQGFYNDAMVEHDTYVGQLLAKLDELGLAEDTLVLYSTDNGPHYNRWPDAGITHFRGEKNTNWEGAFRVPMFVRWPARFPGGRVLNDMISHQDWLPTMLSAAGLPGIRDKLLTGFQSGDKIFKVHIDGVDMLPYLAGEVEHSPRESFFYVSDDAELLAVRYRDYKFVFMEQRAKGMQLWAEPFVKLRLPKIFHLRRDPFERGDEDADGYWDWLLDHAFMAVPVQVYVRELLESFKAFPPRQPPASFNLDHVLEMLKSGVNSV
ncbi:arylsulfatase [Nannocystis radixulma]|uniref:Arylsulfatase n=1 Tax=Nannocystis radixulma TaxID=2995305 RepID=A0ABT5BFB8_9BACT|nr:arylsulfatase [Nannocystis radixulma]MDC0672128.1 arylsulfatase [Nannocystis radixulma]